VPGVPTLWTLAGLNDAGLMRAAALADRLAAVLAGEETASERLGPALPDRWQGRRPRFTPWPSCTLDEGPTPAL
jgi:glycine/D-amino acid oxidase-like deaminating enzyme